MEARLPRSYPTPDLIAAARAFVGNPARFGHLADDARADLLGTSWRVLRDARPAGDPPAHCTVTDVPRWCWETGLRGRRTRRTRRPVLHLVQSHGTPGDAA
jgi:hypothetical protein